MGLLNHFVILIFMSTAFFSCAKTDDQITESAIREARYHLTGLDCDAALEVLDDAGQDKDNPEYVAVYASAIACQAGYSDLTVALPNFTDIVATAGGLLNSFAAFASSNETDADAASYAKIKEAIDYILEADGGAQPDTVARIAKYGAGHGNDLSMQALIMLTVATGKYFAYYGNTDVDGVKGAGSNTGGDICIAFYPFDAQVDSDLNTTPLNGCNDANSGHLEMDPSNGGLTAAIIKRRMCEGVVLFNNLFEILSGIDLSSNESLGNLNDVTAVINNLFTAAAAAESGVSWGGTAINTVRYVTSQSYCEDNVSDADLQRYFVLLFETNL